MNEAITTEDPDKIREAIERLKTSSMEIGKAIYSQQNEEASAEPEQQPEEQAADDQKTEEGEKKEEEKKKD